MNKPLIAGVMATAAFLASALPALAHGGGIVDQDEPSCMGQLARLHANGKDPGTNEDTVKGFGTDQNHPNLDGPYYGDIQAQAKAFQAFCGIGQPAE